MKLPNMHNVTWPCLVLFDLLLLLALGLLNLLLFLIVEAASRHLVQTEDRLVRVLDEDKLGILALATETHVGDGANNTPTIGEREVHLVSEIAGLPADNAQYDVLVIGAGSKTGNKTADRLAKHSSITKLANSPKLHHVCAGKDALNCPAGELATVVLHLGSNNSTTLGNKLASPVKSTAAALSLAVKLVESMDADVLILAADGVPLNGVDLCSDDKVDRLLLVEGKVEPSVLVGLAGRRVGILRRVVEGIAVSHSDLRRLALDDDLVSEVVVDVGGLLGKGIGLVDGVLTTISGIERSIGGILIDRHHIKGGIIALVQEDLVTLSRDDNVPGVNGSRRAHEHGQNTIRGEDSCLVLLGKLLDYGIG